MSMLTVIAITSWVFAVILFLVFVYQLFTRRRRVTRQIQDAEDSVNPQIKPI
jgi:uncharacterized membrane protein